jgi:pimeloyl-ACP methyl ester carboxylesterase
MRCFDGNLRSLGISLTNIEYAEHGQGPTLLFVAGSFGTGAGWKPVMENLGDGYRFSQRACLVTAEQRNVGH